MKARTVKAFAKWLAKLPPEHYDQTTYGRLTSCGASACMAGNFCIWRGLRPRRTNAYGFVDYENHGKTVAASQYAAEGMGLNWNQAYKLFSGHASHRTPKMAARALLRELQLEEKNGRS